jgi:hypothetical protein
MQAARLTCVTPFDVFVVNCRRLQSFCLLAKGHGPGALEMLREGAKADLAAASLGEALKLCIEATGLEGPAQTTTEDQLGRLAENTQSAPLTRAPAYGAIFRNGSDARAT